MKDDLTVAGRKVDIELLVESLHTEVIEDRDTNACLGVLFVECEVNGTVEVVFTSWEEIERERDVCVWIGERGREREGERETCVHG